MLVYTLESEDIYELRAKIASRIRMGFEVIDIVVNPNDKKPYKCFMLNKNDTLFMANENLNEEKFKIIDVSKYKIPFNINFYDYMLGNCNTKCFVTDLKVIKNNGYIEKVYYKNLKNNCKIIDFILQYKGIEC